MKALLCFRAQPKGIFTDALAVPPPISAATTSTTARTRILIQASPKSIENWRDPKPNPPMLSASRSRVLDPPVEASYSWPWLIDEAHSGGQSQVASPPAVGASF